MKKLLSIILSLIMILTMLPTFAINAFAGETLRYGYYPVIDESKAMISTADPNDYSKALYLTCDENVVSTLSCNYNPNGTIDVSTSNPTFSKVQRGSVRYNGTNYSNSFDLKASNDMYLTMDNMGRLAVTPVQPEYAWVNAWYGMCFYSDGMYHFLDLVQDESSNYSIGIVNTTDRYARGAATFLYNVCKHENMIFNDEVRATCEEDGHKAYYHCEECNENYLDSDATESMYEENSVIYSTGHNDANGDLICDNCSEKLESYKFVKVTRTKDIVPGGTYILVDEHNNAMGKTIMNTEISSVNLAKSGNYFDYYSAKSAGAMIFTLKHIYDFQDWGEDVSTCYGMHIDGKQSLACEYGNFHYDRIEGAKYGMKFNLNADSSAFITSWFDETWGGSEDLMHFTSYTGSIGSDKGEKGGKDEGEMTPTFFSMKPASEYPEASESKVYLYRMVKANTVSIDGVGNVNYEATDAKAESDYTFRGEQVGNDFVSTANNVNGLVDAISEDVLVGYVGQFAENTNDVNLTTMANISVNDYKTSDDGEQNGYVSFDVNPVITDGTKTVAIKDADLNGKPISVTLYTAGINPEQIVHTKNNGQQEAFYPEYAVKDSDKAFSVEYDREGNMFVTFEITEFSNIALYETPIEISTTCEHSYNSVVTKNPTCSEFGEKTYTCSNCGDTYVINKDNFTDYDQNEWTGVFPLGHTTYNDLSEVTIIKQPNCSELGECTWKCKRCGEDQYDLIVKDLNKHNYKTTTTKATATADGKVVKKCVGCGKTSTTTIKKVSTVKLSATKYTYDGKVKSPTLTVKDSSGKALVKGTDYTVTTPSGRKNVGKYTYKITFKGNYSGTKSLSFVINPKNTSISKLTATKGGFKATIKKYTTQTTGYQIRYSTKSNMSGAKTVTIAKNTTTSKSVTGLSKGKKYYVQIRTFKTVNGTKYYSAWSGSKTVTTKK